jgi:hypothetical protein
MWPQIPQTLGHYPAQIGAYSDMTSTERGLIVLMTTSTIIPIPHLNPAIPLS